MFLKQFKVSCFPILMSILLTGCIPTPSTDITEESQIPQLNNEESIALNANLINGVWQIAVNDATCQLSTTHTKQGQYYLASARSCPAPLHDAVAWQVKDNSFILYGRDNKAIVTLTKPSEPSDNDAFLSGSTDDGVMVTMSR